MEKKYKIILVNIFKYSRSPCDRVSEKPPNFNCRYNFTLEIKISVKKKIDGVGPVDNRPSTN